MLVDGVPVKSCTHFAVQADGARSRRSRASRRAAELHPIQQGFHEEHGLQCGFCTPGMMLVSAALLEENPDPTEEEIRWALSGNICRCTGYQNIVKSVQWAANEAEGDVMTAVETEHKGWLGRSVKRKEDARFIVGRGNYVEDIKLPGMLHMAILRSPYAHATINSIDTSRAAELPGVVAVVTGELLAEHKLAWMPTLSGDTQAVLATDKVRMQGQEVACVIAEDPYVAHDALELIDVDYEPLPGRHDAAGGARGRRAGHPRRQGGPGRQPRLPLGGGRRGGDGEGVRRGRQGRPARRPTTRAATRRRSSAAAASPTSTRRPARRRST